MPQTPPVRTLPESAYCSTTVPLASARKCCTIVHKTTEQKEKEITWVRAGCVDCLPSSLPPHQLLVLVSGRADGAGQPAPSVSGLAILEAASLAASVGSFLFSWKIGGGGLETPWMRRHTRPVWLTSMARWEEESFWFSLVHEQVAEEHWSQSLEDKALPSGSLNQVEELSIKWHNINPWEDRTVFFLFFTWAGKTDQDPTDQWLLVPPKPSGSPQNFTGFHLLIWN